MDYIFQNLEPEKVWRHFWEVLQIPRASKKEAKIADYIVNFARQHNLEVLQDDAGNVLIRKSATKGNEQVKSVVLQAHLDMVCEKNADVVHNFEIDPIKPRIIDGWVKATGTTLGADNGIGIAIILAILSSDDIIHGPIEALFTVDEETGLNGAFALKPDFVKSRILINMDNEKEGEFCIGCAGGIDTNAKFTFERENIPAECLSYKVSIMGLKGGHSGEDINKGRGNANKILVRLLWNAKKNYNLRISDIQGGNLRNAIPREAFATVIIPLAHKERFENFVDEYEKIVRSELSSTEPELRIKIEQVKMPKDIIDKTSVEKILNAFYALPHGVIAMSFEVPGLVETSTNFATIKTLEDSSIGRVITVETSQRSAIESAKKNISDMVVSVFKLAGAEVSQSKGYPGWKPNKNSEILNIVVECYKRLFNKDPQVVAIHAGLECGLIGEKYDGMDMIAIGPTIKNPHSPDEQLEIKSVPLCWDLLLEVLRNITAK